MSSTSGEPTRRAVLVAGTAVTALATSAATAETDPEIRVLSVDQAGDLAVASTPERWRSHKVNLAPARWIWLPCGRVLPNTFVLFTGVFGLR